MSKLWKFNRFLLEQEKTPSCPVATFDLEINTLNRDDAIKAKHINYGPLNLTDEQYWEDLAAHWSNENRTTTPEVAKESRCKNCAAFDISPRMKECMPGEVDKDGYFGYCWFHNFKCHSERTCYTWAAGGPIEEDQISLDWQAKQEDQDPVDKYFEN